MDSREIARRLIEKYYKTFSYPFTHHHINSFDQFISSDIPAIIKSFNPTIILQDKIGTFKNNNNDEDIYKYTTEIFIGGLEGDRYYIGTPTISLKDNSEVRVLFPNEARLRNLTYASSIEVDIVVKITFSTLNPSRGPPIKNVVIMDPIDKKYEYLGKVSLFKLPIMLHSRYCLLNNKPNSFLREIGECIYDYGGYFIVDGSEKVLITRQEQAFNTIYIEKQENNPKVEIYASIQCLNPETRKVKRIAFSFDKRNNVLYVSIPLVRKPLPVFILFRAMGVQSDNDILRLIFPDENDIQTKMLEPYLHETLEASYPFLDQYSAIQYIKVLTKGFSVAHVYDIILNSLFIHCENTLLNKAFFLAECVRKILRVKLNIDKETDKDDIRNQRCLPSGFLTKMLFQNVYKNWLKAMTKKIDESFKYNVSTYSDEKFLNIFSPGNISNLFLLNYITDGLNKGFKGKWIIGPAAKDSKTGAIQPLSRLSYLDFLSHCRRVNLEFDTGLSLQGPRRLHTTQFGYFCTSETPGGSSIGITKNLSNFTAISIAMVPKLFIVWLNTKMGIIPINELSPKMMKIGVPIYINGGIIGYIIKSKSDVFNLVKVCKLMKWTGCLPCYSSIAFNIRERRISFYFDEGRPVRPLIHIANGKFPLEELQKMKTWDHLVKGDYEKTKGYSIANSMFIDPLKDKETVSFDDYFKVLEPHIGIIEYVDPYESNEAYIAMYREQIVNETTHVELHPSTMLGLLTSMIPFPNHNQSPRNQLSCSQSKQGVSIYSTGYKNRFDIKTHILCYGEAPLVRTSYYDYVADGSIGYGHNLTLAMGCFTGYNQEDGIIFNADSFQRGMFRNITYHSYEVFEEDDKDSKKRIANPEFMPGWTSLKPGIDYTKLDERGIIKKGEYVDETTVLVGRYTQNGSNIKDDSLLAQVWSSGIVEEVVVTVNNAGLALVKVRVIQDRIPELGDKFSNRHGQKGTIGMLVRACDMPRTANGLVPDMMMNPHAIPSRMTIAQLLESLLGKAACLAGCIGDGTAFMNESGIEESIGKVLQNQYGLQKYGEELMYDGMSGTMIPSTVFVGNVYTMRLKHMVEDKWNARGEGRKEQKTRQPTGGRGNQGGLRIGEMDRDTIISHGISSFIRESYMTRSDGTTITVCNGCGTVPIINPKEKFSICPLCDGPLQFIGDTVNNLELLPTMKRSTSSFSKVEIPFCFELLNKELYTYLNMFTRYLTTKDVSQFNRTNFKGLKQEEIRELLDTELIPRKLREIGIEPETILLPQEPEVSLTKEDEEDLAGVTNTELDETDSLPSLNIQNQQQQQNQQQNQTVMVPQPPVAMMVPQPPVAMSLQPQNEVIAQEGGSLTPTLEQPYVLMPITPSIAPTSVLHTIIPNAPATLIVDTSAEAMEAEGFTREITTPRSILKKPNTTRSFMKTSFKMAGDESSSSRSSNAKVNIVKEGQ